MIVAFGLGSPGGLLVTYGFGIVGDKLGDPGGRMRRRFYAKQWNMFAETFDVFLARQERLVRIKCLSAESPKPEVVVEDVLQDPVFARDLEALREEIQSTFMKDPAYNQPVTTAELINVLEGHVATLAREIREEEDILAIVWLLVIGGFINANADAALINVLEEHVATLAREIREEEDIIAIVWLLVIGGFINAEPTD